MTIFIFIACALLLILLIVWGKIIPFIAFVFVSIVAGLLLGLPSEKLVYAIQKGIGDTIGGLVTIVIFGAMLGKLIAESGAAQKIAETLANFFGAKYIQWALVATGFIVGTTLFYGIGFVLLIPLIFSVVYEFKLPAVYIGLPTLAALSVTHGFLPPHPAPVVLVQQLKADMGLTLFYGILIAIPAIIVAGPVFSKTTKKIKSHPLETFRPKLLPPDKLPGTFISFFSTLLPVFLLMVSTVLSNVNIRNDYNHALSFLKDPTIVMLVALIISTYTLGINCGLKIKQIMNLYEHAVKDISMILFIIGGAGSLKTWISKKR